MRNLKVNRIIRTALKADGGTVTDIVVNGEDIYYMKNCQLCLLRNGVESILSPEKYEIVASAEYLPFENVIWFATANSFVIYSIAKEEITDVKVSKCLLAAAWNATKEVLAVVHEDSEVATYVIDYENRSATRLECSRLDAAVPKTVYVGWGSAINQFRGSDGKLRPNATDNPIQVKPVEDVTPRITWRGNGEMFAINYWRNNCRTFKVFECNCNPLYEGESTRGLQSAIAWRPEGNMIASCIQLNDRYSIVIFEKNGFKRFTFPLVYDACEVKELKWSLSNCEILAVQQAGSNGEDFLSLYTSSNYKWYLKQRLVFSQTIAFNWSPLSLTLEILTQEEILFYEYKLCYSSVDDNFAVIDGKRLNLTCFKDACVPPPMSQISFQVQQAINFVIFSSGTDEIIMIDSNWQVYTYNYKNAIVANSYKLQIGDLYLYDFNLCRGRLCCIGVGQQNAALMTVNTDDGCLIHEKNLDKDIIDVQLLQELNAKFYRSEKEVVIKNDCDETILSVSFPTTLLYSQYYYIADSAKIYIFSLTVTNNFFLNDKCISNRVTSFIVLDAYLLLTTSENLLYCLRLSGNHLEKLLKTGITPESFTRPIEQGGQLVCGISGAAVIILQIPRGNLEIISCRLIAIDILEKLLDNNNWYKALNFIRTERLNFNLLIDLNPERFLSNITEFAEACDSVTILCDIIQEIVEDNVCDTIYMKCCLNPATRLNNKRSVVCNALLSYFEEIDYANYLIPIVMIALYHFEIGNALIYIQDLLTRSNTEKLAADAVKILIVHAKHEDLYKKSLQLYDTKLVRYVCGFTQMDPKLYLPFLNEIDSLSEIKRRYTINVHLNRPEIAIRYLLKDKEADPSDVFEFLKRHPNVNNVAYNSVEKSSVFFKELSKLYGNELSEMKAHAEAAIVYRHAELWEEACEQYKLALNWQSAITMLDHFDSGPLQRHKIIVDIADILAKEKQYNNAAYIYQEYLNDYESAVKVLVDGFCFKDALFTAERHKREDIVVHDIIPAIEKYCIDLEGTILEKRRSIHGYRERLVSLRDKKLEKYRNLNLMDITISVDDQMHLQNDFDLYSDAGSQATSTKSTRSGSSRSSARSKRKEERKKQDLKKGGVYEDIALIRALHTLIEEIFKIGPDIRELCLVLLELYREKEAKYLHGLLKESQIEMKKYCKEIWPELSHLNGTVEERVIKENFSVLDERYRSPPPDTDTTKWYLAVFNK